MNISIADRGTEDYEVTFDAMKAFTHARTETTPDELWLVEHPPVYTQGQAGKSQHLLANPLHIPVVASDRGGQITYHGPGQLVCYFMLNLKNYGIGIRSLVRLIEQSVINLLAIYNIDSAAKCEAPGVYVDNDKICSIGLRVKKCYTYHGLALNVNMDLKPFDCINPCGYSGLKMTQMASFYKDELEMNTVKQQLIKVIKQALEGYA